MTKAAAPKFAACKYDAISNEKTVLAVATFKKDLRSFAGDLGAFASVEILSIQVARLCGYPVEDARDIRDLWAEMAN